MNGGFSFGRKKICVEIKNISKDFFSKKLKKIVL